jgi:Pregnancy-associated plasma protein-A
MMMGGGGACSPQSAYTPDMSFSYQNTPNLVFKVNYHFVRPSNGSGPYAGNLSALVATEIGGLNWYYDSMDPACLPVNPPAVNITDAKVRFVLAGIYYHDDDARYNFYLTDPQPCSASLLNEFGVDIDRVINIFYFQTSTTTWSYGCGLAQTMNVNLMNCMPSGLPNLLTHELGHVLGLWHTYFGCCGDDQWSDTFYPDCNTGWVSCGVNSVWGGTCQPGTSTGVSNNIMGGNSNRKYLSPMQLAKIQHETITTDSKRMYVLCQPHAFNPTIVVSNSAVWASSKIINANIEVQSGVVLDVRCTLYLSPHVKIIVKPGGKLVVNGGRLTSHSGGCNTFWQGIQAWGNSAQHQYGSPTPTYQGMVILKNGAVVEHALIGVQTQNPNAPNTTGGVVQVQGTASQIGGTFLNCQKAVDFDAYQNFNPFNTAQLRSNRSYFNFCDFVVDANYRGTATDFLTHVDLWKVDGLRFTACNWKNLRTTTLANGSDELGQGILSLDAKYTVSGACTIIQPCCLPCPAANLIRSTFTGLDHGIDASVAETDRAFLVTDCGFTDNVVGVYSRNVNSFQVLRSKFNGGGRVVTPDGPLDALFPEHRGVFTSGGHGFRIEENRFERTVGATADFAGTWVNNSGQYNDVVYKNTAINCKHGFVGEGLCSDPASAAFIGLQFLCNTNNNPTPGNDIFDKQVAGDNNAWQHSIRQHQGSMTKPAGNVFTLANPPYDASDIRNNTLWPLNYWHLFPSVSQTPVDVTAGFVPLWNTFNNNTCPSNFTDGSVNQFSTAGILAVKAAFASAKAAYINTAYSYNALLDGGNTDQLINEVEHSWPADAWELRNELIDRSPHVSEEVLREVVEKNIMPQAMLLEVLMANPDATKQNGFVKWVEYDAPFPLPAYMIELIVGSWEERTFRTQLESSMAQQHGDMSVAANLLISECKSDTTGEDTDSTLVYWKRVPSFGARYSEVLVRLQRGEYTHATTLLNNLDESYLRLTGYQLAERDNGLAFVAALSAAHSAGHDVLHLTTAEKAAFRSVAAVGCDRPAQWAQNILCYGYGECTGPCTGGAATQRSHIAARKEPAAPPVPLVIYPNPAQSFATLAYELTTVAKDAVLVLRSVEGAELQRIPVFTTKGQYLLDTRAYAPGTYTVDLVNGGDRITTQRFVLKP